jgi:cell division protein FtsN
MARNANGKNCRKPFWGGILLGLLLGLGLSLLVALMVGKNNPFVENNDQAPPLPVVPPSATDNQQSQPETAPNYDFYKSLPPVSASAPASQAPPPAANSAAAAPLWLQAGAFQNPAEADVLRARLALLGVEAQIETASLPDKGAIYRVRIGPFNSQTELDAVRKRLTDNAITAQPVRK